MIAPAAIQAISHSISTMYPSTFGIARNGLASGADGTREDLPDFFSLAVIVSAGSPA